MRPEHLPETANATELQTRLRHVYWIGGGSGAGKSVVARRVAELHGLCMYSTDDAMQQHDARSTSEDAPLLSRFKAMSMDERWTNRSPETMFETFHWFRGELFGLIVEDLLRQPTEPPTIVEGFRLLPSLVKPLLAEPSHALWLLPTPEFRRVALARRGSLWEIAGKTNDPDRALRNLLERDRMFTDLLRKETGLLALPAINVDVNMTENDLVRQVTELFGL
jgi:hypothetical protein